MKWSEEYVVTSHDVDFNGVAKTSTVLRYHQETAHRQLEVLGPNTETLKKNGYAFLLGRMSMCLYHPLREGDKITSQSWACESKGTSYVRCGSISRGDEIISELYTVWALTGIHDRKLHMVDEIPIRIDTDDVLDLDIPTRLRLPRGLEMTLAGERKIVYSDIDMNMHMNNTFYPDLFCDFLPSHGGRNPLTGNRVVSIMMNFFSEAPIGETVKIYTAEENGCYYFKTIRENGSIGVEAELVIDEI